MRGLTMALLLCACGNPGIDFPGTGGGGGGELGGGGAQTSSVTASSSSGFGGLGGSGGGAHAGGAGGAEPDPICPAPACLGGGDGNLVVNCDPACGPVHDTCDYCAYVPHPVIEQPLQLMFGLNAIRLPPIAEQLFQCGLCDNSQAPIFSMWFRVPETAACMSTAAGPAFKLNTPKGPFGTESWSFMCDNPPPSTNNCLYGQILPGPNRYIDIRIAVDNTEQLPDGGSIVRIWLDDMPNGCVQPSCPTDCSGDGD